MKTMTTTAILALFLFCINSASAKDPGIGSVAVMGNKTLANIRYVIQLTTGSKKGTLGEETAGTDSKVEVRLHGSKGVSHWFRCDNAGNDFEANSTGTYVLYTSHLGDISRIEVRKDNGGTGPGWFLTNVKVYANDGRTVHGFYGKILNAETRSINLNPQQEHVSGNFDYTIVVRTGSKKGALGEETAGTDSKVEVRLHGSKGVSHWFRCNNPGDDFVANSTGTYQLSTSDLGEITNVEVRKDNAGTGPDWLLDVVEVSDEAKNKTWYGRYGKMLKAETTTISLVAGAVINIEYEIKLKTGSKKGVLGEETAGTASKVEVRLHGSKGSSHWFRCNNAGNDFEANSTGKYLLSAADLGDVSSIEVRKNNAGAGPGWLLETIEVSYPGKTLNARYGMIFKAETKSFALH